MFRKTRLLIGILGVLLLTVGVSAFGSEAAASSPEVLKITAPANVYAHIYRPFPEFDNQAPVEELIAEGRFRPEQNAGSSWIAQLGLYWSSQDVVSVGIETNGHVRMVGIGTSIGGRVYDVVDSDVIWSDLRIRLTESRIEMWARGDGDWVFVRGTDRPASMAGLPAEIIVGKGWQSTSAPFDAPHLDNSYDDPGEVGVAYIDDILVSVDGKRLFHEEFNGLDGWEMHIDPEYEDEIHIEVVPKPQP